MTILSCGAAGWCCQICEQIAIPGKIQAALDEFNAKYPDIKGAAVRILARAVPGLSVRILQSRFTPPLYQPDISVIYQSVPDMGFLPDIQAYQADISGKMPDISGKMPDKLLSGTD